MPEQGLEKAEVFQISRPLSELLYQKTTVLFKSNAFKRFTTFPAFMMGRSQDWTIELVRQNLVAAQDSHNPQAVAVGYQKEAAVFGRQLYDLMRVAADGKEGTACSFCGSGVYSLGQDSAFAKLAHLDQIRPEGDPDLFWRNEYVLNCNHCGGHTKVDISAVTQKVAVELMGMNTSAANAKIKELNLREVIDSTLEPFRHGIDDLTERVAAKFTK